MWTRERRVEEQPTRTVCDASGLCEEVESVARGEHSDRVLHATDAVYTMVDIAPVTLGHLMIVPREHVPSLGSIQQERLKAVHGAARRLQQMHPQLFRGGIVAVEHGSGREPVLSDCVRHAHLHVVPQGHLGEITLARLRGRLRGLVENLREVPWSSVLPRHGVNYVMVEIDGRRWIANCPRVRYVARRIIARLSSASEDRADWMTCVWNPDFSRTLQAVRGDVDDR